MLYKLASHYFLFPDIVVSNAESAVAVVKLDVSVNGYYQFLSFPVAVKKCAAGSLTAILAIVQGNLLPNFCLLRECLMALKPQQQPGGKPGFHFQYWSGVWERRRGGTLKSTLYLRQINIFTSNLGKPCFRTVLNGSL